MSVLPPVDRRAFLRQLFLMAGAAGMMPLLSACGSDTGGTASAMAASRLKQPRPPGRFASLGPLGEPNAFGVRLPAGFDMRVIAEALQPVGDTGYRWHIFPDGGGVMAKPDGGWFYMSNSEVPGFGSLGFTVPELAPLANPVLTECLASPVLTYSSLIPETRNTS